MKLSDLNSFTTSPEEEPKSSSRRNFLATAGAAALLSACGSTQPGVKRILDSTPNLNTLPENSRILEWAETHPEVAADLARGVARLRAAEAADNTPPRETAVFERMLQQTQPTMVVPDSNAVISHMQQTQPQAFAYYQQNLRPGQHGIYIDGHNKHLYILQGTNDGFKAIRRVLVTTGAAGFSNVNNSGGTPLGAWPVQSVNSGRLGEVKAFRQADGCPVGSLINSFQQGQPGQSRHACIVTEYLAINGLRGIGIHGTNYESDHNGNLRMQQDASGGCIRCTNADIAAIVASGYVSEGMPVFIVGNSNNPPRQSVTQPAKETQATPSSSETTNPPSVDPAIPPVKNPDTPIWG